MTTLYIAAPLHDRAEAERVAAILRADGHHVVSSWHADPRATVDEESALTVEAMREIALRCLREVEACAVLVWICDDLRDRCGSAVEVGYALRCGVEVVALGRPPSAFGALCHVATLGSLRVAVREAASRAF